MTFNTFRVGDRVEARTSGFVPAGTCGTVEHVLESFPKMYYVLFDGYDQPKLLHARDVERADRARVSIRWDDLLS